MSVTTKRGVNPIEQAHFVDMNDKDLLELLGFLYEEAKNIEERMKSNEHIERLEGELKTYKNEKYLDHQKALKTKLRSVRAVAQAKGLTFTPKWGTSDE